MVDLNERQIIASRTGIGSDDRTTAALTFAKRVLATKGRVEDGDIAEIIAHVALNVFTNYFNTDAQVDIDFPSVSHSEAA
jgi:hypothetical protein